MKVLDLSCAHGHVFEGWFASEQDFADQCEKSLVQCPVCADANITKKPSAPRLNLSGALDCHLDITQKPAPEVAQTLAEAWVALSRKIVVNTEDVGQQFAEEARRIHYGETRLRAIRGQTTMDEAKALVEEGIEIMPLLLTDAYKNPLH